MKLVLFLLLVTQLSFAPKVFAQGAELSSKAIKFTRKIIVQTDLEEPISNLAITCKQMPKKIGVIGENEIVLHELITDTYGQADLQVSEAQNFVFSCTSKTPTTADYCWYFPSPTLSFDIYETKEKNKPIYLVAQTSPNTCNKQYTEAELQKGIETYLPTGTPLPFKNKNLAYPTPTPQQNLESTSTENTELTLWQWIVQKIKSMF